MWFVAHPEVVDAAQGRPRCLVGLPHAVSASRSHITVPLNIRDFWGSDVALEWFAPLFPAADSMRTRDTFSTTALIEQVCATA